MQDRTLSRPFAETVRARAERAPAFREALKEEGIEVQETTLEPGRLYRVVWPGHYNPHQRTVGFMGEFLRWETRRCQMHGERLGREAVFQKVKPSGRRGSLFAVDPAGVTICQEPAASTTAP